MAKRLTPRGKIVRLALSRNCCKGKASYYLTKSEQRLAVHNFEANPASARRICLKTASPAPAKLPAAKCDMLWARPHSSAMGRRALAQILQGEAKSPMGLKPAGCSGMG